MNKIYSIILSFNFIFLFALSLSACKEDDFSNTEKEEKTLTGLQKTIEYSSELYALSSGGAYLVGDGAIFYIQNDKAIKVEGLPSEILFPEIHPLANGSAIYIDSLSSTPQIFLLTKHKAVPITESSEEPSEAVTESSDPASLFFVENQRLKRKLKEAEEAREDFEAPEGDPEY